MTSNIVPLFQRGMSEGQGDLKIYEKILRLFEPPPLKKGGQKMFPLLNMTKEPPQPLLTKEGDIKKKVFLLLIKEKVPEGRMRFLLIN